jgi:hypothetical protein
MTHRVDLLQSCPPLCHDRHTENRRRHCINLEGLGRHSIHLCICNSTANAKTDRHMSVRAARPIMVSKCFAAHVGLVLASHIMIIY